MKYKAVIFDLDGVVVCTDEYHYLAWKKVCDEEGVFFNRAINQKLRGIGRSQSLEIILQDAKRHFTPGQKKELADRKNEYYRALLEQLTPDSANASILKAISGLKESGVKVAIGSSSRNAGLILEKLGLTGVFDTVVDGTLITRSKPDPEVFLLAAERLGVSPSDCVVVEDAFAGIDAAAKAGAKTVGVGYAAHNPFADVRIENLDMVRIDALIGGNPPEKRQMES